MQVPCRDVFLPGTPQAAFCLFGNGPAAGGPHGSAPRNAPAGSADGYCTDQSPRAGASRARASISTSAPLGSAATATVLRAGGSSGKNSAYMVFIAAKSPISARKTVVLTT